MRNFLVQLAFSTVVASILAGCTSSGQTSAPEFEPRVDRPAYEAGEGPVVLVDEAHFNYHRSDGRYRPFAELLRLDGYVVRGLDSVFSTESLGEADILVIANALAEDNTKKWVLPNPSAFTAEEIAALENWVEEGGALFLIADHMPFPGAAEELAAAFEVYFINGYASDPEGRGQVVFERSAGTLADHPIVEGRGPEERIEFVKTFGGQAFRATREVSPLLVFPPGSRVRLPVKSGKFTEKTPEIPAAGLFQGAVFEHGRGRVAVFGEAAMFSAQVFTFGERTFFMGMNDPEAEENPQFLLNVVHWLSGLSE